MGNKKKKGGTPVDGAAKGTYPLERAPHYAAMATTASSQSNLIKQNPDYTKQSGLQTTVVAMDAAVTTLQGTLGKLEQNALDRVTLETQRTQDAANLVRTHDAVETAVNTVCQGQKASLQAYAATVGRPVLAEATLDAALYFRGKSIPGTQSATFQCKADGRGFCYHFQTGTDPTNPGAWPPPVVESGCKHTVTGLTPGQKLYGRVAIQRRKVGLGQWSAIVEVIVR
jgi:hypothetical protein